MLLYGKPIADKLKTELQSKVKTYFGEARHYVAILFFGENASSTTYVKHKQKYAKEIGLLTFVFGQAQELEIPKTHEYLATFLNQKYQSLADILTLIDFLNQDPNCVGIMIQLPLPEELTPHKLQLLQAISEQKDIDGLGGTLVGKSFFEMINFTPATPKAVMKLLDHYQLGNLSGKHIAIIGQSTIVGKPLALECLKRGAIVQCFDIRNTVAEIEKGCQKADFVFSGTGSIHLVNDRHTNEEKNQIFIDIGYGHLNGKAAGDIDFDTVKDRVLHITPVPGGVGPLTIASLFENVIDLWERFYLFKNLSNENLS